MSQAQTLATFFQILGPAGPLNWHDPIALRNLFTQNSGPPGNPTFPNVGLTTGQGPQFNGRAKILTLFQHLFTCFPQVSLTPINALRPIDGNTTVVETTLGTGPQAASWAPGGNPSAPLSNVVPNNANRVNLPVCAVFTFNGDPIQNLALYFDRYSLANGLWDKVHPPHLV